MRKHPRDFDDSQSFCFHDVFELAGLPAEKLSMGALAHDAIGQQPLAELE